MGKERKKRGALSTVSILKRRTHRRRANSRTGGRNAGALLLTNSPYWSLLPPLSRSVSLLLSLLPFLSFPLASSRSRRRRPCSTSRLWFTCTRLLTSSRRSPRDVSATTRRTAMPIRRSRTRQGARTDANGCGRCDVRGRAQIRVDERPVSLPVRRGGKALAF